MKNKKRHFPRVQNTVDERPIFLNTQGLWNETNDLLDKLIDMFDNKQGFFIDANPSTIKFIM